MRKRGRSFHSIRWRLLSEWLGLMMPIRNIKRTEGTKRITIIVKGGKTIKACLMAIPLTDQMIIEMIRAMMAAMCILFPISDICQPVYVLCKSSAKVRKIFYMCKR